MPSYWSSGWRTSTARRQTLRRGDTRARSRVTAFGPQVVISASTSAGDHIEQVGQSYLTHIITDPDITERRGHGRAVVCCTAKSVLQLGYIQPTHVIAEEPDRSNPTAFHINPGVDLAAGKAMGPLNVGRRVLAEVPLPGAVLVIHKLVDRTPVGVVQINYRNIRQLCSSENLLQNPLPQVIHGDAVTGELADVGHSAADRLHPPRLDLAGPGPERSSDVIEVGCVEQGAVTEHPGGLPTWG